MRAARYGIEGKFIDFGKEAEVPLPISPSSSCFVD